MSDHAAIARDQLQLAQKQLAHLDESVETPAHQLMVFVAAAIVHACFHVAETCRVGGEGGNAPYWSESDEYARLVTESAGWNPTP